MDALVAATLAHSLIPPVVPEFPNITVGGAFAGTAGESSSFKYGFFDRSVAWFEIILADGEIVIASEKEKRDLFEGAAGTFGTLGVVTLFELRLINAKPFVELTYWPCFGILDAQEKIDEMGSDEATDFIDGIMFASERGVIMSGRMVDQNGGENLQVATFSTAWDPWFYLHAEEVLGWGAVTGVAHKELIPLVDYLFRYDRGAFWTGRWAFDWFRTPFNWATRYLLDDLMHTKIMYHALHRSGMSEHFVIQDMALPKGNVKEFFDWLDGELNIYPQWLCPLKQNGSVSMHPHTSCNSGEETTSNESLLNIGVWGNCPGKQVAVNRKIEKKLKSLGGMKWLYAQTFYTEQQFWSIYDRDWYDDLRKKYKAERLPNVYDKVGHKGNKKTSVSRGIWRVWPLAGVYGVLSAIKGGDYMMK